jgi:hypothetical protein
MTKRILLLAAVVLLLAPSVFAQANEFRRFEIGSNILSYAWYGDEDFAGGNLSFVFHKSTRLAFVADLTVYENIDLLFTDEELTLYTFGPRYTLSRGGHWMFFGQALAGGARVTDSVSTIFGPSTTTTSTSENGFSLTAGGGIDLGLKNWIAIRLAQVDYSFVHFGGLSETNRNGVKAAIGVVFRFGK